MATVLLKTGNNPGYGAFTLEADWSSTQNAANNTSTITVSMYFKVPSNTTAGPWTDGNGSYIGTTGLTFTGSIGSLSAGRHLLATKSFSVTHNSDGTKTQAIYWKWGVNSSWGGFVNPSGSFNVTLPTIPRASSFSVNRNGSNDFNHSITVSISSASTSFRHNLRATFGSNYADYITTSENITSKTFTIPDSWLSQIPNATSGTGTFTLTTYSGSTAIGTSSQSFTMTAPPATMSRAQATVTAGTTVQTLSASGPARYTYNMSCYVGSSHKFDVAGFASGHTFTHSISDSSWFPSSTSGAIRYIFSAYHGTALVNQVELPVTLGVPSSVVPTLTSVSTSASNTLGGDCVVGKTTMTVAISGATGSYGSSITAYSITGNGLSTASQSQSFTLSSVGTYAFTGYVRDSRGRQSANKVSSNIVVYDYYSPRIVNFEANRCNSSGVLADDGTYVKIVASGSIAPVNNKNTKLLKIQYKTVLSSTWVDLVSTSSSYSPSINSHYTIAGGFLTSSGYNFRAIVTDYYGSTSLDLSVSTASAILDIYEDGGVGIGKMWERGALDIQGDVYINGTPLSGSITQASLLNLVYPVGSIYMSVNNVSPTTFLGGTWASFSNGRVLVGHYASDADFNAAEKYGGSKTHTLSANEMPVHTHSQNAHTHTQDAHTHSQNAHTHTQNAHNHTQAAHNHAQHKDTWMNDSTASDTRPSGTTGYYMGAGRKTYYTSSSTPAINNTTATNQNTTATNNNTTATNQSTTATNNNAGGGAAHNNMPPYMVVYMWKRTA